jgi:hypothetical protein
MPTRSEPQVRGDVDPLDRLSAERFRSRRIAQGPDQSTVDPRTPINRLLLGRSEQRLNTVSRAPSSRIGNDVRAGQDQIDDELIPHRIRRSRMSMCTTRLGSTRSPPARGAEIQIERYPQSREFSNGSEPGEGWRSNTPTATASPRDRVASEQVQADERPDYVQRPSAERPLGQQLSQSRRPDEPMGRAVDDLENAEGTKEGDPTDGAEHLSPRPRRSVAGCGPPAARPRPARPAPRESE